MNFRLLLTITLLFWTSLTHAQLNYRFRNLSISEGLSQSSITTILQDDVGTLWLGTQDGLNRFDGHQFEVFTSDDTKGLESEYIQCSRKDKSGNLWFGTTNGLTKYDPKQEAFKTYSIGAKSPLSVISIDESANGDLWLGTLTQGLTVWSKKTQKISIVKTGVASKNIPYVKVLNNHVLLLSTEEKGLYTYDTESYKSIPVVAPLKIATNWLVKDVEKLGETTYLLSSNKGLWLFDLNTYKLTSFLPSIEKDLGIVEIADVLIPSPDVYYVATQNKGLLTVRKEGDHYTIFQSKQDIFQKDALLFDELNTLFQDENGAIWIGTLRGLSCFDPINQGFLGISPSGNLTQGLPSASVWNFVEDPSGKYAFIATDGAVSKLNRKTGQFEHFYLGKDAVKAESSILSLHWVNANELLVGCTNGFYQLNHGMGGYSFKKLPYKDLENPTNFDKIYCIEQYSKDEYFLGCKGGALLYNTKTKSVIPFVHSSKYPKASLGNGVCRVVHKGLDSFYFGPSTGGLYELKKRKNGQLVIVPFKYNEALAKITKDYVSCIYQADKGGLWIGTTGSGMLYIDLKTGAIKSFKKAKGLPNNFVYGILPDKANNLWVSTNKGLSVFNIATEKFVNYTEVHGLMSNEFNTGAFMASTTGELFFGGIAGYNYFRPNALIAKRADVEVRFTKFKLDDQWIHPTDKGAPFTETIADINQIELSYRQRSFSLRFVATDLMNPQLLEFKYRLLGSEEEDVFLGSSNEIRFNALSPGTYTLEVFVRRTDGDWNNRPAILQLEVDSPFWWKWWFIALMVLVAALGVVVFIRRRVEQSRREQVRLEMKIVERTREIREQNVKIELQKQIIEDEKTKVEEQKRLLQIEKDKSEKLLNNIIPEATAQELKTHGRASARAYKTVSVLFTDFVGFTKIAERMKPTELVNKLDIYFRKFDEIIVANNLEKIKTIGDAYMCAGGVPVRNSSNPIDSVLAALQIQEYMTFLQHEAIANGTEYWELRLGINTGEVTAGVIGSERLAYDIWGSTVNQAQRMEMMGEPGRVTISGATFNQIEPYFECTFRGKVQSKSKGMIDMFTVERIKPELSINGEGIYPNERFQQIVNLHLYSSINYYKAERHIMKVLEKGLSPKLHYHSIAHTKDVVKAVERFALLEGVTDEGLFLLKSAATYHDAGFVESYEKNEPIGARMAEEILPKYGYSTAHINQIKELIFVTQIPHKPKNRLEEIICDADLDYLGRSDFHEIADYLRRELREHGKIDSDRKWDEMQVGFLNMHKYFTPTAIASRQEKKMQNLKEVMERLERNEYAD